MGQGIGVSVKAVLHSGDHYVLLRNERNEWELPGGQIEPGDASPADTVRRECREELGLDPVLGALVDSWFYEPVPGRRVLIVCFEATVEHLDAELSPSDEHRGVTTLTAAEAAALPTKELPVGYRNAIAAVAQRA